MFYSGDVSTIPELAAKDWRFRPPRHCFVRFDNTRCPAILLEWRPKRDRGGVSKWEGLVIYAGHTPATGQWDVRQGWIHGDLIDPADEKPTEHSVGGVDHLPAQEWRAATDENPG